jgi:hypothetical protein
MRISSLNLLLDTTSMYLKIWNQATKQIQKYKLRKILNKRKKFDEFVIDETHLDTGSKYI